jgi:hypothetical protein
MSAGSALHAQPSSLSTADAAKFMGAWVLTLDSPQGPFALTMTLTDVEGKVACELTSDIMPAQKVHRHREGGQRPGTEVPGGLSGPGVRREDHAIAGRGQARRQLRRHGRAVPDDGRRREEVASS